MDMKKVVVLMCVAMMGAGAFAFSFIGPPTAELQKITTKNDKGKTVTRFEDRWGYIFSFSKQNISVDGDTVDDAEFTRHYATWGVALDENFNFNVLLGAVSGEMDGDDLGTTSDFDGDWGFSPGFNIKSTFHHGEKMDLGATFQMTFFETEDTVDGADIKLDNAYDIQVAVGPTVDMGGWKLYGGAFYYILNGDLDVEGSVGMDGSYDVEEDDNFGGFIGAQFQLRENTDLIIEYALGNDIQALSASIGMKF